MKKLGKHAGSLLLSFRNNLKRANHSASKKDIHNLRLDLKQLFALIKVLELCLGNLPKDFRRSEKAIKHIFKLTGLIRDNQLVLKKGHQVLSPKSYKLFKRKVERIIESETSRLNYELKHIKVKRITRELMYKFNGNTHLSKSKIISNVERRIKVDEHSINKELARKRCDYHLIRRWVKEQYFLLEVLKYVFGKKVSGKKISYKEEMGKQLGAWHDLIVFENVLDKLKIKIKEKLREKLRKEQKHKLKKMVWV